MDKFKKKLLTLDDLYSYYSTKKRSSHFSADDEDSQIVVQVDGNMKFEDNSDTEGLLPVVLQSCHIGKNINGSNINQEVMEKALPSFKNRPILGYIHEVDGQPEFYGHNMHTDEDDNIIYDEIPVGVIPESCNAKLEYDEKKDKTYCIVNGYIYNDYTKAAEILEREKECFVSVELTIREMSYNAREHLLNIENFFFSGVTILGRTPESKAVKPGMDGSNIKLSDFSAKNNSMFSHTDVNAELINSLDKLNTILSQCFNINDENHTETKEGGQDMGKFDELLEKYGKTKEDITFEVDGLSDEELESKFSEMFDETASEETGDEDHEEQKEDKDETTEDKSNTEEVKESEAEEDSEDDESESDDGEAEDFKKKRRCSRKINEDGNMEVSFELSHEDICYALYNLIQQFDEMDNEYYIVRAVYDDYFVMEGLNYGLIYGCKYVKEEDNISLDGERWKLFEELLTESEKAELDTMRSNYSAIQEKLNKYEKAEIDAEKEAVFTDESYSEYLEAEEFKSLIENKDNYSVEELKDKAEIAFAKCVKKNGTFSVKNVEEKPARRTLFSARKNEKKKPYGNLFD